MLLTQDGKTVMVQVEAEGDVATAFTLARILSDIPLSRGGPASVVIFDIHALQVSPDHCVTSQHACHNDSTKAHACIVLHCRRNPNSFVGSCPAITVEHH